MRINISETKLRSIIRNEIKRQSLLEQAKEEDTSDYTGKEEEDAADAADPSDAELTKAFKDSAADMAAEVPAALGAEYADLVKSITDLAGSNKSMFLKVAGLVDRTAGKEIDAAQEKG